MQFGDLQAENYLLELEKAFQLLADFPLIGKSAEHIRQKLRCYFHRAHAIYYKLRKTDIFIVRVIDQRMDQSRQLQ